MANPLLGHIDRFRSPSSNDPVNILLVGTTFEKFEDALISHIDKVITPTRPQTVPADVNVNGDVEMQDLSSSSEKENGVSNGNDNAEHPPGSEPSFRILKLPTISKEVLDGERVEQIIDYIIILINPLIHSCLHDVEKMLEFIDPLFQGRKRVDFVFVKNSSDVSQVSKEQMKFFCKKYKVYFKTILIDMDDSIEHHASMCSQKLRRILFNPLVF